MIWPRIRTSGALALMVTLLMCTLVAGVQAPHAWAHASEVATTPIDGELLDAVPSTVRIEFDEDLIDAGAAIVVTAPDGSRVSDETPTVKRQALVTRLDPTAGDGEYAVAYRVVSEDGHTVKGRFTFTVGTASAAAGAEATQPAAGTDESLPSQAPQVEPTASSTSPSEPSPAAPDSSQGSVAFIIVIALVIIGAVVTALAVARRRK